MTIAPPPTLTMSDARDRALLWLNREPYIGYQPALVPRDAKPFELPDGWRFPFDLFLEGVRIRQAILILFVDRTGAIEVEADDTAQIGHLREQHEKRRAGPAPAAQAPGAGHDDNPWRRTSSALNLALERAHQHLNDSNAVIETSERVWNQQGDDLVLAWRFGVRRGLRRTRLLIPMDQADDQLHEEPSDTWRSAGRWSLGDARFSRGRLAVRLPVKNAEIRGRWTVWSCMAYMSHWLNDLGYNAIGPENVDILFDPPSPTVQRDGAACDTVNGAPVIGFQVGERWAEDPSIVLHELGHALWLLLFTRQPVSIDKANANEQIGLEEGFADYIAATLLDRAAQPTIIGGGLPNGVGSRYRLPRAIETKPYSPADADPHEIGHQWVNLLWNVRAYIFQQTGDLRLADRVILAAHLRPPKVDNGSPRPLERYLQSIAVSAAQLLSSPLARLPDIARSHGVAWVAPPLPERPVTAQPGEVEDTHEVAAV